MKSPGVENPPADSHAGKVMELAEKVFVLVHGLLSAKDQDTRIGGFFCFARVGEDEGMFCGRVGKRDPEKFALYRTNACEKVNRLAERLTAGFDDKSTFVTRDVKGEPKKYGGGVRAGDYFLSFSGMPEHADEALCLIVALWMGLIGEDDAKEIADISENIMFFRLIYLGAVRSKPG